MHNFQKFLPTDIISPLM